MRTLDDSFKSSISQKPHTPSDRLARPGKLDGPLWLSARQFSGEKTWAFSLHPWSHATCLFPVPHPSHWANWHCSQKFFLLIALLSHHSIAVWTAQQFSFLQASNTAQGRRTEAANRGTWLSLPSCPHLPRPLQLFCSHKRRVWGQETSLVLLAFKKKFFFLQRATL